ncbi:MAG TPA: hypothetical protein VMG35_10590 [Bryobacteraceae bacterium]|nr:hypothetical protein [Bryobacteraceae bacterium]
MTRTRALYHLARADFLERVRRYSFLLILAFAAGLAYLTYTGTISLQLADYRGVYNSAWAGSMMTLVTTTFITLAGFYMVKNTIQRDRQTRVGLVLSTTPISRSLYTLGKALSNFAVLTSMVAVLAAAAVILQLVNAEGTRLEPAKLLAPFVWVALPAMAMTAAVAVLFETLPVLQGGAGNVIYFFAWSTYVGLSGVTGANDYLGLGFFMRRMTDALKLADPHYDGGFALQAGPTAHATKTFLWNGVAWTSSVLLGRLQWVAIAIGLAWLSALFFQRFDPAREHAWRRRRPGKAAAPEPAEERAVADNALAVPVAAVQLTPLARADRGSSQYLRVVASELRLMVKGRGWWWYLVAAGLFVASLAVPDIRARQAVASFAWLWPVLVWSQMGAREARYDTETLVFSCAHALGRQLPSVWLAGFLVAILAGGGYGIRLPLSGDWAGLAAWLAGALFVPTFALALGVWSGSSKLFEVLYTLWWYVGPMNHTPGADFTGMAHSPFGTPFYLLAALALLMAAYVGRRRKLGYA